MRALRELTVPAPVLDQLEEERVLEFEGVGDAGEVVLGPITAAVSAKATRFRSEYFRIYPFG